MGLEDGKHLLLAGALLGGVLGTLTLAAVLQTDAGGAIPAEVGVAWAAEPTAPAAETETAPVGLGGEVPPQPSAAAPTPGSVEPPLAAGELPPERPTPRDDARGARAVRAGGWTLQFMTTCNPEVVTGLERELGADDRLLLLPVTLDGRSCHRVCWGLYPDRDAAVGAADVPAAVRALSQQPLARPVDGLLP